MKRKYCYIDFEYNKSNERNLNLVCSAWTFSDQPETIHTLWLHKNIGAKNNLKEILLKAKDEGYVFVAFAVTAEGRCFQSLGLDPTEFEWLDEYLEQRQLQNCSDKHSYGTYFEDGLQLKSVPPNFNSKVKQDNKILNAGLVDTVAYWLEVDIDKGSKDANRDLILECKEKYSKEEQARILDYCASDIKYMPQIHSKQNASLWNSIGKPKHDLFYQWQANRGSYAALCAMRESEGLPLHMPSVINIGRNAEMAKNKLISELVNNHYPFFVKHRPLKNRIKWVWKADSKKFAEFIETHPSTEHIRANWKLTDSGKYASDEKYLEKFDSIPAIKALRQTNKLLSQLKWFSEMKDGKGGLFDSIGSDDRIRTHFGIYGTQTGRNAAPAKRFVFAMSSCWRCLIRPPKGYRIVSLDYSSQEFAIAAILSGDKNMIEAYKSGDPYVYFALKAGGTKEDRGLFKATVLGLQFGMGVKALALKLSADICRFISEREAQKLVNLHKKTFPRYWQWLGAIDRSYRSKKFMRLPCGWALLGDNRNKLSYQNFPIQGAGSSITRMEVAKMKEAGITGLATVHDEDNILVPVGPEGDKQIEIAIKVMKDSFNEVLNQTDLEIRIGVDIYEADKPWISGKGEEYYKLLKGYLEPMKTLEDRRQELMNTVFK